jgi:hypothetical protein
LCLLLLAGCRAGGVRSVEAENDRLRKELAEKEQTQRSLEGQVAELKVKLAEAKGTAGPLSAEVLEALPRITTIDISTISGFEPTDIAVPATGVVVWFETLDGKGRFAQAVGTADVEALLLPANVADGQTPEPQRIAAASLPPGALREAYRSSFTGTHYVAELKLAQPIDRGPGRTPSLVVRVEFHDAITGQVLKGERVISPKAPATSSH